MSSSEDPPGAEPASEVDARLVCELFGIPSHEKDKALELVHEILAAVINSARDPRTKALDLVRTLSDNLDALRSQQMPDEYVRFCQRFHLADESSFRQGFFRLQRTSLSNAGLSKKLIGALKRKEITNLQEASFLSTEELLQLPNMNRSLVLELQRKSSRVFGAELDFSLTSL